MPGKNFKMPKKAEDDDKETKERMQKVVAQIIILCGIFLLTWLFIHIIYNTIFGI